MENNLYIHNLLIRLFSGEAGKEEKSQINDWLRKSEENKKLYADLRDIWLSSGIEKNTDNYNIDQAIPEFKSKSRNKSIIKFAQASRKYAAIIALIISLPLVYWMGLKDTESNNTLTTIVCENGDRTNIILPDNTKVWLNSGSKLSFNNNFSNGGRNITLNGEAYFSVTKDKRHPFRVKTSEIDIEVLGTEFNMCAYDDENRITTTLVEGSLLVKSENQQTKIKPNQQIIFSKDIRKLAIKELKNTDEETDWKSGRLSFSNKSLKELEHRMERWFDVDIIFADENVENLRFTGVFERESILEVLNYFSHSPHLRYKIEQNTIIFYSNK